MRCPPFRFQRQRMHGFRYLRWQGRMRFTLVEMLVVIAIIGILASLLMPALQNAQASAKKISCMNNQRQTVTAMMVYGDDFHGIIPIGYRDAYLQLNFLMVHNLSKKMLLGLLYVHNPNMELATLYCPSAELTDAQFNSADNPWPANGSHKYINAGYGVRPVTSWGLQNSISTVSDISKLRLSRMKSTTTILADFASAAEWDINYRHKDGVNVSRADCSSQWVPTNKFVAELLLLQGNSSGSGFSTSCNSNVKKMWDVFDTQ